MKYILRFIGISLGGALLCLIYSTIQVEVHKTDVAQQNTDCAVVFGAAVWGYDTPSHALTDRVLAGVDLWQDQKVTCLVLSGGTSENGIHEVDVMQTLVQKSSEIPEALIELDYEGEDTWLTVKNLDPTRTYTMVSNDFHLARIGLLGRRLGLRDTQLHAAPYIRGHYARDDWYTFREILAWWYVWVFA